MFFNIWWASHIFIIDARFFICFFNDRQLFQIKRRMQCIYASFLMRVAKPFQFPKHREKLVQHKRETFRSEVFFSSSLTLLMSRNVEDLCEIYFTWNMNKYLRFDTQNRVPSFIHLYICDVSCAGRKRKNLKSIFKSKLQLTRWWRKWRERKSLREDLWKYFQCWTKVFQYKTASEVELRGILIPWRWQQRKTLLVFPFL